MRRPASVLTRAGLTLTVIAALGVMIPAVNASGRPLPGPTGKGTTPAPNRAPTANRAPAARPAQPGVAATPVFNLCAKTGTKTMPDGTSVPIWGFALDTGAGCGSATADLPGPVIDVQEGDSVTVHLENGLGDPVSIAFPGQNLAPDLAGAPAGGSTTYTFTASRPGTFLYEAGTNVTRQVAMGLYGTIIVRPATPGRAYPDPNSAYDVEAVLLLSGVDPAFNANPAGFNLLNHKPKYWLINGKGYPGTTPISASAGQRVLLRYLNAGVESNTMMLLGMHERFIAKDAAPITFPYELTAETFPSGSTGDAIATIPSGTPSGTSFALFNRNLRLTNGDGTNPNQVPGGMLTFIQVP
jgi:FtsP/CotA-like multicopper oxidase with cupredoxin domain